MFHVRTRWLKEITPTCQKQENDMLRNEVKILRSYSSSDGEHELKNKINI